MADPQKKPDDPKKEPPKMEKPSIRNDGKSLVVTGDFYLSTVPGRDGLPPTVFLQSRENKLPVGPQVPFPIDPKSGRALQPLVLEGSYPIKLFIPQAVKNVDISVAPERAVFLDTDAAQMQRITLVKGQVGIPMRSPVDTFMAHYEEPKKEGAGGVLSFRNVEVTFASKEPQHAASARLLYPHHLINPNVKKDPDPNKQRYLTFASASNTATLKDFEQSRDPIRRRLHGIVEELRKQPLLSDPDKKLAFPDFEKKKKEALKLHEELKMEQARFGPNFPVPKQAEMIANRIFLPTGKGKEGLTLEDANNMIATIPHATDAQKKSFRETAESNAKAVALHHKQEEWVKNSSKLLDDVKKFGIPVTEKTKPALSKNLEKALSQPLQPRPEPKKDALPTLPPPREKPPAGMEQSLRQFHDKSFNPAEPSDYSVQRLISEPAPSPRQKTLHV